jgi:hypothetical protein
MGCAAGAVTPGLSVRPVAPYDGAGHARPLARSISPRRRVTVNMHQLWMPILLSAVLVLIASSLI